MDPRVWKERFSSTLAGEAAQFEKDFVENTPNLNEWKIDYPFVSPTLESKGKSRMSNFLLNRTENGEPTLTMSYTYPTGLVQEIKVESTRTLYPMEIGVILP